VVEDVVENVENTEETNENLDTILEETPQEKSTIESADKPNFSILSNLTDEPSILLDTEEKEEKKSIGGNDGNDYMSLDSIGKSLGAFISLAGDKLHETYMGFGQEKKEEKIEEKKES